MFKNPKVFLKNADTYNVSNWGQKMNENIQSKKYVLKELESLICNAQSTGITMTEDITVYCEYMKRFYLSCSTNN